MRLSDRNARRLTALIWRERLRRWLPALVIAVVLFGAVTVFLVAQLGRSDRTVDVRVHDGTVIDSERRNNVRGAAIVHVHLDDGRNVDAFSVSRVAPPTGAHVIINESRHASGRLTFDVIRLAE